MKNLNFSKWFFAQAFVLIFFFSLLLVPQKISQGRYELPLLPTAARQSPLFTRLAGEMSYVSSDLWVYFHQSQLILKGERDPNFLYYKEIQGDPLPPPSYQPLRLPYRDLPFEYPPFAFLFVLIPGILTSNLYLYSIFFSLLASSAYLLTFWVLTKIIRDLLEKSTEPAGSPDLGAASLLFLLFLGPLAVHRLDIFAAYFLTLSLRALQKENSITLGIFLSLGVATKIYPMILFPLFILYILKTHSETERTEGALRFAISFFLTLFLILLPFLILTPEGLLNFFHYHARRGVEIESLYSSFAQIGSLLGVTPANVYVQFGSHNIAWAGEDWVKRYWSLIAIFAMGLVYLNYYLRAVSSRATLVQNIRRGDLPNTNGRTGDCRVANAPRNDTKAGFQFYRLLESAFLLTLSFLLTNKVLSPQFLIWLFPLFLIVGLKKKWIIPIVFQIALASQMIYPFLWDYLVGLNGLAVGVLAWRNLLLLTLFLFALKEDADFKDLKGPIDNG